MSKSLSRQIRRAQARKLAEKILDAYPVTYNKEGEQLPTVEQLYTLIGAKDGFIYDLQLQLSGLNQEYQKVVEERDKLQDKVTVYETPSANIKAHLGSAVEISSDVEDDFGATFKPH